MSEWKETGKPGQLFLVDKNGCKHYKTLTLAQEDEVMGAETDIKDKKINMDSLVSTEYNEPMTLDSKIPETEEVKVFPLPTQRCNCGEEIKDFKESEVVGRDCHKCGQYHPAPNETFDMSKVNFKLPDAFNRPVPRDLKLSEHDMPCPWVPNSKIAGDHATNQWVANHLPLTGKQKLQLLEDLMIEKKLEMKDRVKLERQESGKTNSEKITQELTVIRKHKGRKNINPEKDKAPRRGVKESKSQVS